MRKKWLNPSWPNRISPMLRPDLGSACVETPRKSLAWLYMLMNLSWFVYNELSAHVIKGDNTLYGTNIGNGDEFVCGRMCAGTNLFGTNLFGTNCLGTNHLVPDVVHSCVIDNHWDGLADLLDSLFLFIACPQPMVLFVFFQKRPLGQINSCKPADFRQALQFFCAMNLHQLTSKTTSR